MPEAEDYVEGSMEDPDAFWEGEGFMEGGEEDEWEDWVGNEAPWTYATVVCMYLGMHIIIPVHAVVSVSRYRRLMCACPQPHCSVFKHCVLPCGSRTFCGRRTPWTQDFRIGGHPPANTFPHGRTEIIFALHL